MINDDLQNIYQLTVFEISDVCLAGEVTLSAAFHVDSGSIETILDSNVLITCRGDTSGGLQIICCNHEKSLVQVSCILGSQESSLGHLCFI